MIIPEIFSPVEFNRPGIAQFVQMDELAESKEKVENAIAEERGKGMISEFAILRNEITCL